jgi:hypothetical protein
MNALEQPNPYQAPMAPSAQASFEGGVIGLGLLTTVTAIGVLGGTLLDGVVHACQLLGPVAGSVAANKVSPQGASGPAAALLVTLALASLGMLLLTVCSWVLVPVWMHSASSNLRRLGRWGMQFSPAGCAGSFFIPIVNLWWPAQAMSEIWRASDPETGEGAWVTSSSTPLVAAWWAAYLVSGFVALFSFAAKGVGDEATFTAIGTVSVALRMVSAVALVRLMRGVSVRQEKAAVRQPAPTV